MAKHDPNLVMTVKTAEVDADFKWNARREVQEQAQDTGEPNTGYLDIVYGIAKEFQKTPAVVRPHPKAGETVRGKKAPPYFLCSGFQRYKAITEIAAGVHDDYLAKRGMLPSELAGLKTDKPTIRVFIRDLNDFQARKENIQENTIRCSLSAPDIAFGMADLFKQDKALTTEQAGTMLGISPTYAGVLRSTFDGLKDVVVPADHPINPSKTKDMNLAEIWRQETVRPKKDAVLAVAQLKMGKGDAAVEASSEEKLAKYVEIRGPKPTVHRGPGTWHLNAIDNHAIKIGTLLGNLQRDGALELIEIEGRHVPVLLAPFQKIPTAKDEELDTKLDMIAVAIKKAYNKGLQAAPVVIPNDASEAAATTDGVPSPPDANRRAKKVTTNGRAAST